MEVKSCDCWPIHAHVETSEISLGPTVPSDKFKRKFFNIILNEQSGTTNYLDITYTSGGTSYTVRTYIGAYDTIDIPKERVASIEADPDTDVTVVASAASIEVTATVVDL